MQEGLINEWENDQTVTNRDFLKMQKRKSLSLTKRGHLETIGTKTGEKQRCVKETEALAQPSICMRVPCGAKAEDELSVSALLGLEEGK